MEKIYSKGPTNIIKLNPKYHYVSSNGLNLLAVEFERAFRIYKVKILESIKKTTLSKEPADIGYIEETITKFFKLKNISIPYISLGYDLIIFLDNKPERALGLLFNTLKGLYCNNDIYNLPVTTNGELVIDYKDDDTLEVKFYYLNSEANTFTDKIKEITNLSLNSVFDIYVEQHGSENFLSYIKQCAFDIIDIVKYNSKTNFYSVFTKAGFGSGIDYFKLSEDLYDFVVNYKEKFFSDKYLQIAYFLIIYIEENLYTKNFDDFLQEYKLSHLNANKLFREVKTKFYFFIEKLSKTK